MESYADAEERDAIGYGGACGDGETEVIEELSGAEVTYAGEDDFIGPADVSGRLGDQDVGSAEVAQGLDDAGEIAGAVVDDGDHAGEGPSVQSSTARPGMRVKAWSWVTSVRSCARAWAAIMVSNWLSVRPRRS